jgi:hypothetical protein
MVGYAPRFQRGIRFAKNNRFRDIWRNDRDFGLVRNNPSEKSQKREAGKKS